MAVNVLGTELQECGFNPLTGFYRDGWSAVTCHERRAPFSEDVWELHHLAEDPTESRDVAAEHPERHVITRSLGGNQHSEPDLFVLPVAAAPRLVLCSDGISGMLDHEQMRQVLATSSDPDLAAEALLAAALDAGGRDNATVVVVDSSPAPGDTDPHADTHTTARLDLEQRLGALP